MRLKDRIFSKSSIVGLILIVAAIVSSLMFFKSDNKTENTIEFLEATIIHAGRIKEEDKITGAISKQNIQIKYTFNEKEYKKIFDEVRVKDPLQVGDILQITIPSIDSPTDISIITDTSPVQNYTLLIISAVLLLIGLFMIFIYY